jgi:hypothetical protein
MPTFDIAWNRRHLEWRRRPEAAPWMIECVLLERVLIAGKSQLRIVCRIAAIDEERTEDPATADRFWHDARARLGRLHRLSPRDVDVIEAALAVKVPKQSPVSQAA